MQLYASSLVTRLATAVNRLFYSRNNSNGEHAVMHPFPTRETPNTRKRHKFARLLQVSNYSKPVSTITTPTSKILEVFWNLPSMGTARTNISIHCLSSTIVPLYLVLAGDLKPSWLGFQTRDG